MSSSKSSVVSDTASQVTLADNASTYSKTDAPSDSKKPSLLNLLRGNSPPKSPSPSRPSKSSTDPYKNWEARYQAANLR
ncbi:hypothetical protein GMORB2_7290 [Geosmithia morbida]|uniref:Uncharacterized protein n=1 Tax=Geosmithia morbida TaxID=1094350 RepID=A0A9P5D033_9HYPO|nr:uncharacterized protein GMORB2_7290 [Geosmithia morbida]KAF4122298.1 hypothetical protein GMORB2_7290 [Geosmithia morbida]